VRRHLTGVDGRPLGVAQPRGGENLLNDGVLAAAVLLDARRDGADLPLNSRVLLPWVCPRPEDVADREVIAERQRTSNDNIRIRPCQSLGLLERPPERNAELAQRPEPEPCQGPGLTLAAKLDRYCPVLSPNRQPDSAPTPLGM